MSQTYKINTKIFFRQKKKKTNKLLMALASVKLQKRALISNYLFNFIWELKVRPRHQYPYRYRALMFRLQFLLCDWRQVAEHFL